MQTVFLSNGIKPISKRKGPMTYGHKLAVGIAVFGAALLLAACLFVAVSAATQRPEFPDVITTQPNLK